MDEIGEKCGRAVVAARNSRRHRSATIDGWRVLDWLDQLVEKSLVISEEYPDRERRYRMLETLRHYATDRLDHSGEAAAMRTRYHRWCLRFAESAYLEMRGPNQAHWLWQVEREHDNLRQALQDAGPGEVRMRVAAASMPLLELGRLDEATALILEAQQIHREMRDNRDRSAVTHTLGRIALMENETTDAERIFSEALTTFREIGARRYIAAALSSLGDAVCARGEISLARSHYRESIPLEQEAGNRQGILTSLRSLALLESGAKDAPRAVRLLGASEAERERLGIPLLPHDQAKLELAINRLRSILGEANFENVWEEGVATSLDAAVRSAIGTE